MPDDWKQHCPIEEEAHPVQRQAWKGGWTYRTKHGPDEPDRERVTGVLGSPSLFSVWIQGFSAADRHERDH